jgi:hypothetical protein
MIICASPGDESPETLPSFPKFLQEASMDYFSPVASALSPQTRNKPLACSIDSGQECTLDHWIEITWLEEREDDELAGYLFEDSCFVGSRQQKGE